MRNMITLLMIGGLLSIGVTLSQPIDPQLDNVLLLAAQEGGAVKVNFSKTASVSSVMPGEEIQYTIVITSLSPFTPVAIEMVDTLPDEVVLDPTTITTSTGPMPELDANANILTWSWPEQPLILPATIEFTVTAKEGLRAGSTIRNDLDVTACIENGTNCDHGDTFVITNVVAPQLPDIAVSPTSLTFGEVNAGESRSQSVTIRNEGDADLNVTSISLANTGTPFRITSSFTSGSISPGGSRSVDISFAPNSAGSFSNRLVINSDDPDEGQVNVSMSGSAVLLNPPTIDSIEADAPHVLTGDRQVTMSVGETLTLRVTASDPDIGGEVPDIVTLTLNALPDNATFTDPDGNTPIAGNPVEGVFTFTPDISQAGLTIELIYTARDLSGLTDTRTTTIHVRALPDIEVDPLSIDFGEVELRETATATIKITNAGDADLFVNSITIEGDDSPFHFGGVIITGFTLEPGGMTTIDVFFSPTEPGTFTDNVVIKSKDPDEQIVTVQVKGINSAQPGCIDDIELEKMAFQPVQVVFNDKEEAFDTNYLKKLDEKSWQVEGLPLVKNKNTVLFGLKDYEYRIGRTVDRDRIALTLVNHFRSPKNIGIRFLWGGIPLQFQDIHSTTSGMLNSPTTSPTMLTLPAGVPVDDGPCVRSETDIFLSAPLGGNPPSKFKIDRQGPFTIIAVITEPDFSELVDADPTNHAAYVDVEVAKTKPLNILWLPIDFEGSTSTLRALQRNANQIKMNSDSFLKGVFPVAETKYSSRVYNSNKVTFPIRKTPSFQHEIRRLQDFRALGKTDRNIWRSMMSNYASGLTFLGTANRVVMLVDPVQSGPLSLDRAAGMAYTQTTKKSVWVEWNLGAATVAHELGHTFDLWTRADQESQDIQEALNNNANPNDDLEHPPEEYTPGVDNNHPEIRSDGFGSGRDSNGYWVNNSSLITDHFCFMGATAGLAVNSIWIDQPDYKKLIDKFVNVADPEILAIRGLIFANGNVEFSPWYQIEGIPDIEPNHPGNYSIVLLDDQQRTLETFGFNVEFSVILDPPGAISIDVVPIAFNIPFDENTHSIQIRDATDQILAERTISPNSPIISSLQPSGGETFRQGDPIPINWSAADADQDLISFGISYSPNEGETWIPLDIDFEDPVYTINSTFLEPGDEYLIRIFATDGINTSEIISASTFSIVEED